jgi:hypothetical protein
MVHFLLSLHPPFRTYLSPLTTSSPVIVASALLRLYFGFIEARWLCTSFVYTFYSRTCQSPLLGVSFAK